MRDVPDPLVDERLAKFVVNSHIRHHPVKGRLRQQEAGSDDEDEMETPTPATPNGDAQAPREVKYLLKPILVVAGQGFIVLINFIRHVILVGR